MTSVFYFIRFLAICQSELAKYFHFLGTIRNRTPKIPCSNTLIWSLCKFTYLIIFTPGRKYVTPSLQMWMEEFLVHYLCNVNQQNALFKLILVLYMFPATYDDLQEGCIVHAASYNMFSMRLCKQSTRLKDVLDTCKMHVKYSLPVDEHKMFETCRKQEELD